MKTYQIILLVIASLIIGAGTCSYTLYKSCQNAWGEFPEYAKEAIALEQHKQLIETIDTAIASEKSFFGLAAKLEKLNYPSNIRYVGIKKRIADDTNRSSFDEEEYIDIIGKREAGMTLIKGNAGIGTYDDETFLIIMRPVEHIKDVVSCEIFIRMPANESAQATQ